MKKSLVWAMMTAAAALESLDAVVVGVVDEACGLGLKWQLSGQRASRDIAAAAINFINDSISHISFRKFSFFTLLSFLRLLLLPLRG